MPTDASPSRFARLKRRPLVACAALLGFYVPEQSVAMTVPVGCCGDTACKGSYTLRIAINHAGEGDTVDLGALPLACSTITLTGGEIAISPANLTIVGPTSRTVTVSGNNVGRVFYHSGSGTLTLSGFEVAYGHSVGIGGCIFTKGNLGLSGMIASHCHTDSAGGAVFAYGSVDASGSTVYANDSSGYGGGGIAADQGIIVMSDSIVSGNSSKNFGGGLYTKLHGIDVSSTTITNNHVAAPAGAQQGRGGGIAAASGLTMHDVVVDHNSSEGDGGGVWADGIVRVTASMISYNTAPGGRGGGVFSRSNDLIVTGSTIAGNGSADTSFGGGIAALLYQKTNDLTISNSTISGNQAKDWGGVQVGLVYTSPGYSASLAVTNCTIAFNRSVEVSVAGLYTSVTETHLESSIIVHNSPHDMAAEPLPHFLTGANNIVMDATEILPGTLTGDPYLVPLALHGGKFPVHAIPVSSIAVDHGDNSANLDYDERGPGFARSVGAATDIGAYERQANDDELFYNGFE